MPVPTKSLHGRPLPPIPAPRPDLLHRQSSSRPPLPPLPQPHREHPPSPRHPHPSRRSKFMLFRALQEPSLLASFLSTTSWPDFHALMNSGRDLRHAVWANNDCRDVILSHYLPGYAYALEMCSMQQRSDIEVTFHLLSLLSTSSSFQIFSFRHLPSGNVASCVDHSLEIHTGLRRAPRKAIQRCECCTKSPAAVSCQRDDRLQHLRYVLDLC